MKIIDFDRKGNVVRFYLGEDSLEDWWGDDWNDVPYEHNAGSVYPEYVKGHKDIAFPYDALVLEPCDGVCNSLFSKDDMIQRRVPCIIVVPAEMQSLWDDSFSAYAGGDKIQKFYFGDRMEADND
jgi:hypothetical protein